MKKRLLKLTVLLLLVALSGYAQERTVSGKVAGKDGSAMPGVNVVLKGTGIGTTTDSDGGYKISVPSDQSILIFSFIGHANEEVTVGSKTTIEITLREDATQLGEIVVTALGIEKNARTLGYAMTKVDGSKFTQSREINLGNALTGQIAGVSVAGLATGPSGSSRVLIRGNSSLTGNNQPLYVIDGIPFDNTNQGSSGQWGGADFGDGLSNISPDNIESIQVLKGVAASALYGYRGGNGAILITTKSGKTSKGLGLEVNNNMTFNNLINSHDYQYEYGQGTLGVKPTSQAAALAVPNVSWGAKLDGSDAVNFLGNTYKYSAAKDNFKNFYKTGVSNQASVALTSSGEFGSFRLGLTDLHMNTNIPNSSMNQQGLNLNTTMNVTKKLQASLTANYTFENVKNRSSFSDAPGNVLAGPAYLANSFDIRWLQPAVQANNTELLPGTDQYFNNSYFVAYKFQNETRRNRLTTALKLKYDITDWLAVSGQVMRDGFVFDLQNVTPTGTAYAPSGNITQMKTDFHELNGNMMIQVNKKFGDFSIHANAGGNKQDNVNQSAGVLNVGGFTIPYFYSVNNVTTRPFTYNYSRYKVNSLFVSADLGYKDFLYLTVTARKDWFSTLNPKSNTYTYPSVSGSFIFSEAFKLPQWVSFGKFRASYGQSSNGTSPYRNLLTYGLQGYTINGQTLGYVSQSEIPNNFLKPVKIKEQEVGVNLQFLNNRAGIDVAFYNKNTEDDILPVTVSPTSGYSANVANIGKLRNRGVEVLLTVTPVKTDKFTWDASFNVAKNWNKVLALSPGVDNVVVNGAIPRWGDAVSVQHMVGLPYGQIVGYKYLTDGTNRIYGADGLPMRTAKVMPFGSGVYNLTGGFNNSLTYKGVNLSFLIDFKFGAKIYSGTNLLLYNYGLHKNTLVGREEGVVGKGVDEGGSVNTVKVNAQTYYTSISTGGSGGKSIAEEFVYDASFIKLRSMSIGYSIPQSVLKGMFIRNVTVSLVGRNLATLMKHTPNIDPESNLNNTNGQGLELSGYPAVRSLGFNLNLKF